MKIQVGETGEFGTLLRTTEIMTRSEVLIENCLEPVTFGTKSRGLQTLEIREISEGFYEVTYGYPERLISNGAPQRRTFRFEGENIFEKKELDSEVKD